MVPVSNMQLAESVKKYLRFEEATLKLNAGKGYIRSKGSVASKGLKYHDYSGVYNSKFFFCFFVFTYLFTLKSQSVHWLKARKNTQKQIY